LIFDYLINEYNEKIDFLTKKIIENIDLNVFDSDYSKYLLLKYLEILLRDKVIISHDFYTLVNLLVETKWPNLQKVINNELKNIFWEFWKFFIENEKVEEVFNNLVQNFLLFFNKTIERNLLLRLIWNLVFVYKKNIFIDSFVLQILNSTRKNKSMYLFNIQKTKFEWLKESWKFSEMFIFNSLFLLFQKTQQKGRSLFSNTFRLYGYRSLEIELKKLEQNIDLNWSESYNTHVTKLSSWDITYWELTKKEKDEVNDKNLINFFSKLNDKIIEQISEIEISYEEKKKYSLNLFLQFSKWKMNEICNFLKKNNFDKVITQVRKKSKRELSIEFCDILYQLTQINEKMIY